MGLVDTLLNFAGLLLWLNWRSVPFDPFNQLAPVSLSGTVRRAEPRKLKQWHFLAALGVLLAVRGWVYWQIGAAVDWVPSLHLGAISPAFRSDLPAHMFLYSLLSFAGILVQFYAWLLLLSMVNGRMSDPDALQRLVRLHLGRVDRLPWFIKLVLPLLLDSLLWLALNLFLAWMHIVPPPQSTAQRIEQALVIGCGIYLTWQYLIGGLLALMLLSSYIYLGNHPLWDFIGQSGANLLRPIRWLPLRFGRIDFTPIIAIGVVFFAGQWAERGLTELYRQL